MVSIRVDGNDLFAVYNATKAAREIALRESRPVLIEAMTYRLGHHSTSDDSTAYRSVDEMSFWEKDENPIIRLKNYLTSKGWWDKERDEKLDNDCQKEVYISITIVKLFKNNYFILIFILQIMECFHNAEKQKRAKLTYMFDDVYSEKTPNLIRQQNELFDHLKLHRKEYPLEIYEK